MAVARLLQAWAVRAPLLLFIDDLHWADVATRDLLHYLLLRSHEAATPLLVLLTMRLETLAFAPELHSWLGDLARRVPTQRIILHAFSLAETQQLVERVTLAPVIAPGTAALHDLRVPIGGMALRRNGRSALFPK